MMVETEPIMYTGNGIATEFPLPTGHDGNYVTITAPGAGIKLRVIRDSSYEVVNGRVKFLTPPPKDTVISFTPDEGDMYFKGDWDLTAEYKRGDIVIYDGRCYIALKPSKGKQPDESTEYWTDNNSKKIQEDIKLLKAAQEHLDWRMDYLIRGATEQDNDFAREVIDARLNADEELKETLGENIRETQQKVKEAFSAIEEAEQNIREYAEGAIDEIHGDFDDYKDEVNAAIATKANQSDLETKADKDELELYIESTDIALSRKVDKEEGKGLIDDEISESLTTSETEYLYAVTDREGRLLFTIDGEGKTEIYSEVKAGNAEIQPIDTEYLYAITDNSGHLLAAIDETGNIVFGEIPKQIKEYIEEHVPDVSDKADVSYVDEALSGKVDKEEGKSLVDTEIAESVKITESEYLQAVTDSEGHVLEYTEQDGAKGFPAGVKIGGMSAEERETEYLCAVTDREDRILFKIDEDGKAEYPGTVKAGSAEIQPAETEYLYALTDNEGKILCAVDDEGEVSVPTGVKIAENEIQTIESEYIFALIDSEGHILAGIDASGHVVFGEIPSQLEELISEKIGEAVAVKVDKEEGKSLIDAEFAENVSYPETEYLCALTDSEGKVLQTIEGDGSITFHTPVNGIPMDGADNTNWSNATSIAIPEPRCAVVNISGIGAMPTSKAAELEAVMEFWDMQGNYFRKNISCAAQGNSSMAYPKKNVKIDLLNEDGSEFEMKIGDWIPQDGFHLKAYYTDFFRGVGEVGYELYDEILKTRGIFEDRAWKKALIDAENISTAGYSFSGTDDMSLQMDTGARGFPSSFPCLVYLNGEFYGIFAWQLKKHRDNMHQTKDDPKHIHIDGTLYQQYFWDGAINWSQFEVRNPKNLWCMDGSEYDGDNPKELIDETSEYYDLPDDKSKVKKQKQATAKVKEYITAFSQAIGRIVAARRVYDADKTAENLAALREVFETYFDPDNLIDYMIFSDAVYNLDGWGKNWQWATWDGVKWYVHAYDLDSILGEHWGGNWIFPPASAHLGASNSHMPGYYIANYYTEELEARWYKLRKEGIIDAERITEKLNRWVQRIGEKNFEREYEAWPESPCNGDSIVDTDYWELVLDVDGNPQRAESNTWNEQTTYTAGDTCGYGASAFMGWFTFRCIQAHSGKKPIKQFRYRESIYRVRKWLDAEISNMDSVYHYTN